MISGLLRNKIYAKLKPIFTNIKIPPNWITASAYPLIILTYLLIIKKMYLISSITLILCSILDIFDGLIAKSQHKQTNFGSFFDAFTDRIQELFIFLGLFQIGYNLSALTLALSYLLSYIKARAEMVKPLNNMDWPSIGERSERIIVITLGLFFEPFFKSSIAYSLILLTIILIVGIIQRFFFAKTYLKNS